MHQFRKAAFKCDNFVTHKSPERMIVPKLDGKAFSETLVIDWRRLQLSRLPSGLNLANFTSCSFDACGLILKACYQHDGIKKVIAS